MTYWILPWNKEVFNLPQSLKDFGFVEWRQRNKLAVGDIVFIYCSNPLRQIKYMMRVCKINIPRMETVNDTYLFGYEYNLKPTDFYARFELIAEVPDHNVKLSLDSLRQLGVISNIQGGIRVPDNILQYLTDCFDVVFDDFTQSFYEGSTYKHSISSYERNQQARKACLSHYKQYAYTCQICRANLEKLYGDVGKGFIHVHHINFISSFDGVEHEINPCDELIPVCPNCHAMLHRKVNGKYLTPDELKNIVDKHRKSTI
ncbi:MAG: hypothetical protein K2I69_07145 [Muribaculaceae bacterium]|nr:hypothetical protein [Muribaculaceae bacterium]